MSELELGSLFDFDGPTPLAVCNDVLRRRHYLGPVTHGLGWSDRYGVAVLAVPPRSRMLPPEWAELVRWCLYGERNGGSRQWAAIRRWLLRDHPAIRTVVSYSDPSAGHSGAVYKACGWWWCPTWHEVSPPPTGNGSWDGVTQQHVKSRWVYPLRPDPERADALRLEPAYRRKLDALRGSAGVVQ